jgi:acyl-CoA synthetase (AMP-forming)/AMP-acid ligase II
VALEGAVPERRATTFGELNERAISLARLLLGEGVSPGDRVVLAIARPSRFAAAFVGVTRIGAVAVPIPPADGLELSRTIEDRTRGVLTDCAPRAILADSPRALAIARTLAPKIVAIDVSAIDTAATRSAVGTSDVDRRMPSLEDVAFLQYTSGSTGKPRGVVVRHANLVDNLRGIATAAAFGPSDRCVSWLPLFHDMGLIGGLLLGLYVGTAPHLMEPRTFLLRPVAWLDAMSKFRATFTVAPNFAYSLVATRVPDSALRNLDLSSVRLFFDGAEPIDRASIDAFVSRFASAGVRASAMYPVYGLAEATLAASFPAPGSGARFDHVDRGVLASHRAAVKVASDAPTALAVACLGRALPGHRVTIEEPEGDTVLPERTIGEVVVRGPSISSGYYGEACDRTALRTGDLGYLADGELYVVDRLKDLVIVAGRNYAPSDVERAAASVRGLVPGAIAAFGVRGADGTEALCIVAAIHPTTWRASDVMKAEIAAAVHERVGLCPSRICLVSPGDVRRTSSGKVRRAACRVALESGELRDAEGVLARAAMKLERWRRRIGAALAISTAPRA